MHRGGVRQRRQQFEQQFKFVVASIVVIILVLRESGLESRAKLWTAESDDEDSR